MSATITTSIVPQVPLPLPELEPVKKRHATTEVASSLPLELRKRRKLDLAPAVARHFTPEQIRKAEDWDAKHEAEIPVADNGTLVFPDPFTAKVHRELKRMAERRRGKGPKTLAEDGADFDCDLDRRDDDGESDPSFLSHDDYEALIDSAADSFSLSQEIMARIEAAAIASRRKPGRDRSPDRFMSAIDEYVEPYLAVRNGMSLGKAAKTFGIANIQRHLADVEKWLSLLELLPRFDRDAFLARLARAVEKRRRDATRFARPRDAVPVVVENLPDRGWNGLNIAVPPAAKARAPKRDKPRSVPFPWWADVRVAKDAKTELVDRRRDDMMDAWKSTMRPLGAEASRAVAAVNLPPTRAQLHNRQHENGLLAILEREPYFLPDGAVNQHRRELVEIVDRAQAGMKNPQIARELKVHLRTVERRLEEVRKAAVSVEKTALAGVACHDLEDSWIPVSHS